MVLLPRQTVIKLVVSELKRDGTLPVTLITGKCPKKDKNCTKRHGDYVILWYKDGSFSVKSYSVHSENFSEGVFDEKKLQGILERCLDRHKFTVKHLLAKIDVSRHYRKHRLQLVFTDDEWKILAEKAQKKKLREWARNYLLK